MIKLHFVFFLLLSILGFSQSSYDKKKNYVSEDDKKIFNKEFLKILTVYSSDTDELYIKAKKLLKISKTDKERSRSYFLMGDAMKKKMKYAEAISYLRRADHYAEKSDFISERFLINIFLSNTYSTVHEQTEAKNCLNIAEKLTKKVESPKNAYMINMLYSQKSINLRREKKYCEASDYDTEVYQYLRQEFEIKNSGNSKYNYQTQCAILAYDHLKCGNIAAAKKIILDFETAYNPASDYDQSYYLEFYYLDKALLSIHENNKKEAKMWFDKAIERAKSVKKTASLSTIIEERLLYNIEDSRSDKKYFEEYLAINQESQKESFAAYKNKIERQEKNITKEKNYVKILLSVSTVLISAILLLLYYNHRKNQKIEAQFEEIISNIQKQDAGKKSFEISLSGSSEEEEPVIKKNKLISDSKEAELLEKLAAFEAGKEFTSPNFNKSNLAAILNTNIKYLNIILKEHRGKSFNNYINGLRIDFVVKLLYNEPDHLNYKINYLSELAGFSSHSYFTQIFKKELNIAPAEFISRLSKSKTY